ncbi:MAG: alanine racemase [Bryobacteraceae bacterium]|nr:alanine racemase [Bryobacteraceae bacterium]
MTIHDLDTPAILIDLDVMERNLARMAEYARAHHLRLRPHTKTHKIPALGARQLAHGAAGLTVAKTGEAEVMTASGTPDLLIAYPTVGARKLARVAALARSTQVTMSLDSLEVAQALSDAASAAQVQIGVLVEIDVGLNRVGVTIGPDLTTLLTTVIKLPSLRFEGLAFYPGQVKKLDAEGEAEITAIASRLDQALALVRASGIECRIVSAGSTPTWNHSHGMSGVNEIRPGTYIFNDRNTVLSGACHWADCAASILTTVVSTARPGQAIIDGGSKTFSSDRLANSTEVTFGALVEDREARFHKMNEEHGFVDISQCSRAFRVGDRLRFIPNHICVAMNLHEQVYGIRGDQVEEVWRVEARGKLS